MLNLICSIKIYIFEVFACQKAKLKGIPSHQIASY